tara:strand:- start:446 stop:598 length:153 start_codon:yes stop_codon:yes gene_type:complete
VSNLIALASLIAIAINAAKIWAVFSIVMLHQDVMYVKMAFFLPAIAQDTL